MGLSRLENFLRSFRGNIIYVDPNALDSTDSIENDGTSVARPLKTIQRALIEAARFSHLPGINNDKFGNTTILLYPGEHLIDNRPGWIPGIDPLDQNKAIFTLRSGQLSRDFPPFDASTNFDITSDNNVLYKFNSVYGGVIVPRGTSIVGMDLRKTKIRPKYVPDPKDDSIDRSAIFRLTGSCYLWQFSIFDSNPNSQAFYNYSQNKIVPNFSHHKLTVFEYADGVNDVKINSPFLNLSANRTDLDMYYEKIGLAYGPPARQIKNDYPSSNIDIQTKLDEFRIVGSRGFEVNISNIYCGDGVIPSSVATVELETPISELDVDTAIRVDGVNVSQFNGQFVVKNIIDSTTIQYNLNTTPSPSDVQGGITGTVNLVVDTVSSASPYVFNCSLRSVYGMCGLHADGSKSEGFKSMVVAQYTGISLQKDNNAFVKYNQETSSYDSVNVENIATDSLARYKPSYKNYHIKSSNNAFIQCVSVFAIGFSEHFLSESGGDQSITNSNSNFGAVSLSSSGYQDSAFLRDDVGYITHIISPKEIEGGTIAIEYDQIDIYLSRSVSTNKLYFYNRNDIFNPPKSVIDGYRIGAKINDKLNVVISTFLYSSDIVMQGGSTSYEKSFDIQRIGSLNSISANIITLDIPHNFINGESVRVISKNGNLPEGIQPEKIYYIIASSDLSQVRLASSLNDALNATAIQIYNTSNSSIKIVSRVSDKKSGDIGHPIQFDLVRNQWYINVNSNTNDIYTAIQSLTESATSRTYLTRVLGSRVSEDSIYKHRYVIPRNSTFRARPPSEGYVIQESSSTITGEDEIVTQFSTGEQNLTNVTELRNLRLISDASWEFPNVTINTEIPHNLSVGSQVKIVNVVSAGNTTGIGDSGFNGTFDVISLPSSKSFSYSLTADPGKFLDNTSIRSNTSPHYIRKNLSGTYLVYRSEKIQDYIKDKQDGIYHIIITSSSNSPDVEPFNNLKFSQPIQNLYPQVDRDNPKSDPDTSLCYASPSVIGEVLISDSETSITKEALYDYFKDYRVDFGLVDIVSNTGIAHSLVTNVDHGLNPIVNLDIVTGGSNYGYGDGFSQTLYNANLSSTNSKGEGSTAVINITSTGSISQIKIMSGGSNYAVDDILTVVGIATTAGWVPATVRVSSIYNHVGETLQITGTDVDSYNQLYNITGIANSRVLQVESSSVISSPISNLGLARTKNSNVSLTGNSFTATHISNQDITTFTTSGNRSHGFQVGDKITVRRNDNANLGDYTVRTVISLTSFTIGTDIGNGTSTILPYKYSSTGGTISKTTESESARLVANYAGIATTISDAITDVNISEIYITNVLNTGIKIGDYLEIDNEIVKVKQTVSGNPVLVFRGVFGTKTDTHDSGSVVRKISPIPIEFRRNSILRASGHTFEYLGYGSGNYSTAFPDRQDRQLSSQEELLSQSFKSGGGSVIFTGMNSNGDFYVGNKRISSATGRDEVFDTPIPTSRGEELSDETSLDFISTSELNVSRSIRVDGGKENNIISEFNGPTVFNEKVTINSDIESNSIYLQGNLVVSNKYTVSDQFPIITGTPGDITYYSYPFDGGTCGWIYTIENEWREFGPIKNQLGRYVGIWSGRFIGDLDVYSLVVSGITTILDTTQSTTKDNGALIVEGGVGIEKNLNVGGSIVITGVSTFQSDAYFGDNDSLYFGDDKDLRIWHSGGNSYLDQTETSTGNLFIRNTRIDGELSIQANNDVGILKTVFSTNTSSAQLFYDGTKTLETTSAGVIVTGILSASNLIISGISTFQSDAYFGDNDSLYFGDGKDLSIFHNGSDSYIGVTTTATGNLIIKNDRIGGDVFIQANNDVGILKTVFSTNTSSAQLFYDGIKTLETTSTGVIVTGTLTASTGIVPDSSKDAYLGTSLLPFSEAYIGDIRIANSTNDTTIDTVSGDLDLSSATQIVNVRNNLNVSGVATFQSDAYFGDNDSLYFGDGKDLSIFHNGSDSYIGVTTTATGNLIIKNDRIGGELSIQANNNVGILRTVFVTNSSSAQLFYDGTKTFETTSTGAIVTGILSASTGFVPDASKDAYLGTSLLPFSEAYIGDIRIANSTNDTTIDTVSGDLDLSSATQIVNVRNDLIVFGKSVFTDLVIKNGITPYTSKGAYIGTSLLPFSEAYIGDIRIAAGDNDTTIDTVSGDLELSSATQIVNVRNNLNVTGTILVDIGIAPSGNADAFVYLGTSLIPFSEAYIGAIRIANGTNDTTIDTVSGDLNLSSATQIVNVRNNLNVLGILTTSTGIVPDASKDAYLGTSLLPFSEAYIGDIRIANSTNDTTIDTGTGDLILDSNTNTVKVNSDLTVSNKVYIGTSSNIPTGTSDQNLQVEGGSYISGNLGIGTTSPKAKLDVETGDIYISSGDLHGNGTIYLHNTRNSGGGVWSNGGIGGEFDINNTTPGGNLGFSVKLPTGSSGSFGSPNTADMYRVAVASYDFGLSTGKFEVNGILSTSTGIVPDASKGAYIGTSLLPFSEAYIGDIRIANGTNDTTIDTVSGDLDLSSATQIVNVRNNLNVLGILSTSTGIVPDASKGAYIGTSLLPFSEAYIGDIRIADTTIDTVSGDLILDSNTNIVKIDSNLNVTGVSTFQSNAYFGDNNTLYFGTGNDLSITHNGSNSYIDVTGNATGDLYIRNNRTGGDVFIQADNDSGSLRTVFAATGADSAAQLFYNGNIRFETTSIGAIVTGILTASTGFVPNTSKDAYLGTSLLPFSEAYIGDIRIANSTNDTTIDTGTGDLNLSSATQIVNIRNNLNVLGILSTSTGIVPDASKGAYIGTSLLPFSEAYIGDIRIANSTNDTTIDTVSGDLILDSNTNTVKVNSDLTVSNVTTSATFVGNGTIPVGGIIMWSGASIPNGWELCNGTNGTPNLRDKFIVGSGSLYSTGATGGNKDAVVVSHTHGITDLGHDHGYKSPVLFDKSFDGTVDNEFRNWQTGDPLGTTENATTGITINSEGVSEIDKNLPPYYALAFIMRTV